MKKDISKIRILRTVLALILLLAGRPAQADPAMVDKTSPNKSSTFSTLPDLVVMSITSDNLDNGEVKIKIKNQGMRKAVRSLVSLTMTWGLKTASFNYSTIPLNPGQMTTIVIDVKMSLVQAKFCATADGTNMVAEDNENNNERCGQFGGKP
jgi:hypothetical protein